MTALMIKTHNKTGLKYFCKSTKTGSALRVYKGSGVDWNKHLKIHGKDISTEIYAVFDETNNIQRLMLEGTALEYSELNNIVNSDKWANMIPENGLDGAPKGICANAGWNKGIPCSEEQKESIRNTLNYRLSDGTTSLERKEILRQNTTENGTKIYKDGLTYNEYYAKSAAESRKDYQQEINKKVSNTKILQNSKFKVNIFNNNGKLIESITKHTFYKEREYPKTLLNVLDPNKLYCGKRGEARGKLANKLKFQGWYCEHFIEE